MGSVSLGGVSTSRVVRTTGGRTPRRFHWTRLGATPSSRLNAPLGCHAATGDVGWCCANAPAALRDGASATSGWLLLAFVNGGPPAGLGRAPWKGYPRPARAVSLLVCGPFCRDGTKPIAHIRSGLVRVTGPGTKRANFFWQILFRNRTHLVGAPSAPRRLRLAPSCVVHRPTSASHACLLCGAVRWRGANSDPPAVRNGTAPRLHRRSSFPLRPRLRRHHGTGAHCAV